MTTRRAYGAWLALAGILLGSFGCAGRGTERKVETVPPSAQGVHLVVKNQYGFPAQIYAVGAGTTIRLGKVLPGMVGEFELPHVMIGGPVEFTAALDFDVSARSGPLLLLPGHVVDFVISRPVYSSTATVRR
jgi:hypothetical protein